MESVVESLNTWHHGWRDWDIDSCPSLSSMKRYATDVTMMALDLVTALNGSLFLF